ncbi:hypothetical protein Tco_0543977 [Tanacetum coccineum]
MFKKLSTSSLEHHYSKGDEKMDEGRESSLRYILVMAKGHLFHSEHRSRHVPSSKKVFLSEGEPRIGNVDHDPNRSEEESSQLSRKTSRRCGGSRNRSVGKFKYHSGFVKAVSFVLSNGEIGIRLMLAIEIGKAKHSFNLGKSHGY